MGVRFVSPWVDVGNGITPSDGAQLFFFATGTANEIDTFSDEALTTANANPVIADADGVFPDIFLTDLVDYKAVLKDKDDVQIRERDPVTSQSLDQAALGQILYPTSSEETAAGVTPTNFQFKPGDAFRYNMIGDNSTDNSTAYNNWIKVGDQGVPLTIDWASGSYNHATAITLASQSNPIQITGRGGRPTIKYTGSAITTNSLTITDTNGKDVSISNVDFDANSLAARAVRIDNESASMAAANIGRVVVRDCKFSNALVATGTNTGSGIQFVGGFSEIFLENVDIFNISFSTGIGAAAQGILAGFDDINAYVQKLTVIGGTIEKITNNDSPGVNCDGIHYQIPNASANSDLHIPASMTCWGTKFVNCKGRCVKSQIDGFTIIRDFTVVNDLEVHINEAVDFDLQSGGGIISGGVYYANEISGGGTTWGSSHRIVGWGPNQTATAVPNRDGGLYISDIVIYSAIQNTGGDSDSLPFFALVTNGDVTRELVAVSLKRCSVVGGLVNRWVKSVGQTAEELNITIKECEGDTVTSLIEFSSAVNGSVKLELSGNKNFHSSSTPVLVELFNDAEPFITGHSNIGYTDNFIAKSAASTLGENFRPKMIGGDTVDGNTFVPAQSVTLADDATAHTFNAVGTHGYGMIVTSGATGDAAMCMFVHDTNSSVSIYTGANVDLATGTTSNDTDVKLNVWFDGASVNIRNRLGDSRTFNLFHFGGSH